MAASLAALPGGPDATKEQQVSYNQHGGRRPKNLHRVHVSHAASYGSRPEAYTNMRGTGSVGARPLGPFQDGEREPSYQYTQPSVNVVTDDAALSFPTREQADAWMKKHPDVRILRVTVR